MTSDSSLEDGELIDEYSQEEEGEVFEHSAKKILQYLVGNSRMNDLEGKC